MASADTAADTAADTVADTTADTTASVSAVPVNMINYERDCKLLQQTGFARAGLSIEDAVQTRYSQSRVPALVFSRRCRIATWIWRRKLTMPPFMMWMS